MAVIFVGCFASGALLHRDTAVALVLCGVATTTLVLAVIGANIRSPRRPVSRSRIVNEQQQLGSSPVTRPPEK